MTADTAHGWAEVREVHEQGTVDEWRRYASAETTVPGVLHSETREPRSATVRLEHTYSPGAADDPDPREHPLIVLTVDTDFMCEAYLSADVARRLAAELTGAADRLEATVTAR